MDAIRNPAPVTAWYSASVKAGTTNFIASIHRGSAMFALR
jgi:hypothetical protein